MGQVFFTGAPIGDPNDPAGQKLLTVREHPTAKPQEGMLQVLVHDVRKLDWILVDVPYAGLILSGFPAQGVCDADEMLAFLDRTCHQMDEWKKRRKVILPKPEPVEPEVTLEEPVPEPKAKAK